MSKICSRCNKRKPRSEFYRSAKSRDGLHSYCKDCNRISRMEGINRDRPLARKKKREYYESKRKFLWDYLEEHSCVDCGESDPIVLEFDHVRGEKSYNISDGVRRYSIESLKKEIAKCDVRCANCHRRVTFQRLQESKTLP